MERTADGRYLIIGGQRWRASDPLLPEEVRTRLVAHLMAARRAVGAARRSGDTDVECAARDHVDRAKRGLGERGAPWWNLSVPARRRRWADALEELDRSSSPG